MIIYTGERGSGKTTMLIEMSEKNGCDHRCGYIPDGQVYPEDCGSNG